jgi:predicted ribosomally synthesized peptide with SipW-like signal peptide
MWRLRTIAAVLVLLGLAAAGGATLAAFSDTSVNSGNTMTAKRIFPGVRPTTGWTISDAASGTAADVSDPTTTTNGLYGPTTNWNNVYAANRYVSVDYLGTLPAGLAVTGAQFNLNFAAAAAANNICFYFEVIQTSTGTVLGTHGSTTTPAGCVTGTTVTAVNTSLPEVTSTDIANDVTIKIYAKDTAKSSMRIDRGVVTGSTAYGSFTLYRSASTDSADSTPATSIWAPAADDGTVLATAGNFGATFASTKYVDVTFPAGHVVAGATINSVGLAVKFKSPSAGRAMCVYYEAYSGATLVGTYGSSASPYCSDSSSNWRSDTIALTGVDTVAEVNALRIRIYGQVASSGKGSWDLIQLRPNYHLD